MTISIADATSHEANRAAMDTGVRPQDDLYRHVNGSWLASHTIPADRGRDGTFHLLHDQAEQDVRTIITEAASVPADDPAADEAAKIAAVFASFMGSERIEALGTNPLTPDLEPVTAAHTREQLTRALGGLQRTGVGGGVGLFVENDADDPTRYVVYLTQSGLGLPDEAYYRDDTHAQVRTAYVAHVAAMLALAGVVTEAEAHGAAERIMALETKLAAGHWDNVRSRDAQATHNPSTLAALAEQAPGFDWALWAGALGAPEGAMADLIVRQPSYLAAFAETWATEDVDLWRLWLTWRVIRSRAAYLPEAFVEENFDFYGRTLTGAQEVRERWKRGVSLVEGVLGEAIGKIYVSRHFPPSHKDAMDTLVADLIEAYRRSITELDWMSPATRERALAKLDAFTPKIGYPAKWRDYSALAVDETDLIGNVRAASAFETDYELGKIGKPIDRDEWFMPPQMVNAYYNPAMNEIVFPAAILQPPFFDADADAATNYGAIGAVIGHEIGHGFDDQGSRYDGEGRLHDWWEASDREEFEKRTKVLIDQYGAISPAQLNGSHHVNGALTIGENIGDIGGLGIAIKAYRIALERQGRTEGEVIDGESDLERLFFSWARGWRLKARDEEMIRLLSIDPHSPDEVRCNAVVRNIDEFHTTFGVRPGDGMWLEESERVRIW
ncbi:M13 family metallopeptidase [Occultella kanbiaonis]|uniref:M13 family metallopeptidase n=1 Tax=Occultella kanbiaonis TaxID=2675754 RepID=UPI0012B8422F|nr:M13-type metalloendopeptidase [Occultella kanbiaonis]